MKIPGIKDLLALVTSTVATAILALFSVSALAQQMEGGDPAAGEQKAQVCASCHGADGNSEIAEYPKLAGQNAAYTFKQLTDIRDGIRPVPVMEPIVADMSEQDMLDVSAYYEQQEIEVAGADPELVELGEQIYRSGIKDLNVAACSGCHAPAGTGNAPAGFPALGGQHAAYTAAQLRAFRAGERVNDGDPAPMRIVTERMTDREIEALASYLSGLQRSPRPESGQ